MPLHLTPTGLEVTYSRAKCLAFASVSLLFALLMGVSAANTLFPFLDGTPLEWLVIERRLAPVFATISLLGSLVMLYLALWNARRVLGDNVAIRVDAGNVVSRSIAGRRAIAWPDVASVSIRQSTIFLQPHPDVEGRTVPLSTMLTSVTVDDILGELQRYRPDLFGGGIGRE